MVSLLLALIAAAGFIAASLAAATTLGRSARVQQLSMVLAAGILLGVAFADLIPEALEFGSVLRVAFGIAGGFLALYVVESLTGGHTHHHEPHAHDAPTDGHGHSHAHAHSHAPVLDADGCVPRHALLPFLLGLGIHNVADGIVIGLGDTSSDTAASAVAAGILVHQLPVGLSFAAVLAAGGLRGARLLRATVLIALMIPLGALAVWLLPDPSGDMLGILLGVAAGALLYISTSHLLPEAHSEERHPLVVTAFAVALLGTIGLVGALHDTAHGEHGHEHEDVAHTDEEHHDEGEHADEASHE